MRVVSAAPVPDLLDRFEVVVDPDAEPSDWDEAILDFLEKVVERRRSQRKQTTPVGTPAAEIVFITTGGERLCHADIRG
jgi:hypothetical protein